MTNEHTKGYDLRDDFLSFLYNPEYHDITIICSDSVEIGAYRAILASRSSVFQAMLYGSMHETTSKSINLHEITSNVMRVVLRFIYTGDIDLFTSPSMNEIYLAADFLALHGLTRLISNRYVIICSDDEHPTNISFETIPYSLAETMLNMPSVKDWNKRHVIDNLVLSSLRTGAISRIIIKYDFHLDDRNEIWIKKADDTSAKRLLTRILKEQYAGDAYKELPNEQDLNLTSEQYLKPVKRGKITDRYPWLIRKRKIEDENICGWT